jgi:signal transduction histidine kinase/ActR/RegA family two-component response regulator
MWKRLNAWPYSIRLFGVTAVVGLAMVVLLTFEFFQRQALMEISNLRVDSLTAPAFLLDREFLRFQQSLALHLDGKQPLPKDVLQMHLDLLSSKVDIVRDSPGSAFMFKNPDNIAYVEKIHEFVLRAQKELNPSDNRDTPLRELRQDMADFEAESHSIGTSADLMASILMEQQNADLLAQNQQITLLTLGQLVFLMATAFGLLRRHRLQQAEKAALTALNDQLRLAQQEAEAASRGKSLFLANMSHELRTPFNGIMGILSVLATTPLSPQQADLIQTVNNSAGHFLKLLNDILDASALESGKMRIQAEEVDLRAVMMDVHAIMLPLAVQKQLDFLLMDIPAQSFWVKSDGTRLRQILLNLLNNAIKFTEKGHVRLQFQTISDASGQSFFAFEVADTGIGLHEESLGKLFQRFYQVDSGLSRQFSGVGLGLEISMGLARLLEGEIQVQSQVGQGSRFLVKLPLVAYTPVAAADITPTEHITHLQNISLRVLVAEDHPVNQKFLAFLLQRMGHVATFCENGELALQALQEQDFDVVLMDIHMPVMDGLTATRHIRALPNEKSKIPVIVLSADVYKEARDNAAIVGVDAFIPKPVQPQELQTHLQLHVLSKQAVALSPSL